MWFGLDNQFLYTEEELPLCFPYGQYIDHIEVAYPERYAWLSELIGANLPDHNIFRLRKVMIEERIFGLRAFRYHRHLWELPSALRKLCNDAELTLEVQLRKPRGLYPDPTDLFHGGLQIPAFTHICSTLTSAQSQTDAHPFYPKRP